jgi:hypothetical protein
MRIDAAGDFVEIGPRGDKIMFGELSINEVAL